MSDKFSLRFRLGRWLVQGSKEWGLTSMPENRFSQILEANYALSYEQAISAGRTENAAAIKNLIDMHRRVEKKLFDI